MKFRTELKWESNLFSIDYDKSLLFLGSCFSESISANFSNLKFNVASNPNGIIFHPLVIAELIDRTINNHPYNLDDIVERDLSYFSWFHSGTISEKSGPLLLEKINNQQAKLYNTLCQCDFLFLTFGTAWGYQNTATNHLVANCHKVPAHNFVKKLSLSTSIVGDYEKLIEKLLIINPKLKIGFTISPVRHVKDGIIENSRSKAELLSAAHTIVDQYNHTSYLPVYEWFIDDLRDYRFYKSDLIHPNEQAIKYVWQKLFSVFFDKFTQQEIKKVEEIISAFNHRAIQPTTEKHQLFLKATLQKLKNLDANLQVRFKEEINRLKAQIL